MGDKISGYPVKTVIHNDDLLDFSNTEDSGASYTASQKVKVSELMSHINSFSQTIYNTDGNINETRVVTSNGATTTWLGGDLIVRMDNALDDYAFLIMNESFAEKGRYGFDQVNSSAELSLSNLSGEFFKVNNNEMFVNTDGFFVSNNNRVGVNTSSPLANLHVTGDGSDVLLLYNLSGIRSLIVDNNGSVYNNGKGEVSTNTAFGLNSLNSNTAAGTNNTAFGHNSLTTNATGDRNTAFGDGALKLNTTSENTAFGWNAGAAISTGSQNVAVGRSALEINTIGTGNVAVGYTAGSKITGSNNTAIGVNSLTVTTSASENTAIGSNSLRNTGAGSANTSVGYFSLYNNTLGVGNVASGKWAITTNTIGSHNVGIGLSSQHSLLSGDNNVAIGRGSLFFNSIGDGNIALGNNAGEYALVSNELYIHNGLGVTNTTNEKTNSLIYGKFDSNAYDQRITVNGALKTHNFNAADIALMTPEDGDIVYSTDTDAVITSIGFWGYENGAWTKL